MSRLIDHVFDLRLAAATRLCRGWLDWGRMAPRDRFRDLQQVAGDDVRCVVDAGAWRGRTLRRLLALFPRAEVHGFEPNPDAAARLREQFAGEKRAVIHEAALSDRTGRAQLNIIANRASSSLLTPSDTARRYHGERMDTVQTRDVALTRLDVALAEPPQVLKLDLQGAELEALRGCGDMLGHIRALTAEAAFVPLYAGQPLFADLDLYLRERGFSLRNLYELYTQPDGQLTAGDALYTAV